MLPPNLWAQALDISQQGALAVWDMVGKGQEKEADKKAVDAMQNRLNALSFDVRVVAGEGERDQAPLLYKGQRLGHAEGTPLDLAVDPLEGTLLASHGKKNALSVLSFSTQGGLISVPDVYMDKIAVGPQGAQALVSLDYSIEENISRLSHTLKKPPHAIAVCLLDRPRHQGLVERLRRLQCRIHLISDGDVVGILATTPLVANPIDLYVGTGGSVEGVLAAAALKCVGGAMEARLTGNPSSSCLTLKDLAPGPVVFSATGVTSGTLLEGVTQQKQIFDGAIFSTHSLVLQSNPPSAHWVRAIHGTNKATVF